MEFFTNPLSSPLTVADIAEVKEAEFHYALKKTKIVDRAYYIFKTIAKHFKIKIPNTFSYEINDLEYLDNSYFEEGTKSDETFREYFLRPFSNIDNDKKALINGREYDFEDGMFPYRWLFVDFEQELIDGIKQYEKKLENKKHSDNLKKKRSRHKSKIVNRLKKSMTPEEIEIVFGKDQNVSN